MEQDRDEFEEIRMRKVIVFNMMSVDGYFVGAGGDLSWMHQDDAEWNAFAESNASGGGVLLFGRVTYDMMAGFWPTEMARKRSPVVAERMNSLEKVVFSRTLKNVTWKNTTLVKGDPVAAVRSMKETPGPGLVVLGSGSIVAQLAEERVIDEYQVVVCPVVLGKGRTMFEGIKGKLNLKLSQTRVFKNGNVLLCYSNG